MFKMLDYENKITVSGLVKNFKIKKGDGKKDKAYISILNENDDNLVVVTLYERSKFVYGTKDDKVEYSSLEGLSKEFLDAEGKSKGVHATIIGNATETVGQNGTVYENNNAFMLMPSNGQSQKAEFNLIGMIKSIGTFTDADDNEYAKLKIASVNSYKNKDGETVVRGINEKEIVVRDAESLELLEDCSVGDYIRAKGVIINKKAEYDDWGDRVSSGSREFLATKVGNHTEKDDLDEEHIEIYKAACNLGYGESFTIDKDGEIIDEDDEF